jgi:hypothetical protein
MGALKRAARKTESVLAGVTALLTGQRSGIAIWWHFIPRSILSAGLATAGFMVEFATGWGDKAATGEGGVRWLGRSKKLQKPFEAMMVAV